MTKLNLRSDKYIKKSKVNNLSLNFIEQDNNVLLQDICKTNLLRNLIAHIYRQYFSTSSQANSPYLSVMYICLKFFTKIYIHSLAFDDLQAETKYYICLRVREIELS